jgi:hypothetical protein
MLGIRNRALNRALFVVTVTLLTLPVIVWIIADQLPEMWQTAKWEWHNLVEEWRSL